MNNIASLDLNLLVAFDAILKERNITLAAQRIGLSQPAMSDSAFARQRLPRRIAVTHWHKRYHHDDANKWLRRLLAELFLE